MNRKDLTVAQEAGKNVAYVEYGDVDSDHAVEVMVVDTKAVRPVSNGGYSGRTHDAAGIKVKFVGGYCEGQHEVVQSQKLVATWDEYTARRDARNQREQNRQNNLADTKARAEVQAEQIKVAYEAATGRKVEYGKVQVTNNSRRYGNHYTPATKYTLTVDTDVIDVLLAAK